MIVSDLCTKHRNALIEALEKLNAEFMKRNQEKKNAFAEISELRWFPFMSESVCFLKKNKAVSCEFVFENEIMGKSFMKLFCHDVCNDLIVLLCGFHYANIVCGELEYWIEYRIKYDEANGGILNSIRECKDVFYTAFKEIKIDTEKELVTQIGFNFQLTSTVGKCRVFSRKKCKCFIKPYMNIVKMFLRAYDAFIEIAKKKEYDEGFNDCEGNCRQSIEAACTDAVWDALG